MPRRQIHVVLCCSSFVFFCKQKTAYEMRISDWSSDVCSSDLYEYEQKEVGIGAGELALRLLESLLPEDLRTPGNLPGDWEWDTARDDFIRYAQRRALGPSTASLVRAAEERDIPWLRLNQQSLVQFGHGKYQQRIQATVTGRT